MEQLRLGRPPVAVHNVRLEHTAGGWTLSISTRRAGQQEWTKARYDRLSLAEAGDVILSTMSDG